MRSVSDNGATAPISALTNAFSLGSNRGRRTDDFGPGIIVSVAREIGRWTACGPRPDVQRTATGQPEDRGDLQVVRSRP